MSKISALTLAIVLWGMMEIDDQTCAMANPKQRAATIVSPKRDAEVGRSHNVVGKLQIPGQPIVFVKSDQADGVWWIQPMPKLSGRGNFNAEVQIGTEDAKPGDRFSLVVVILQSQADIEYLRGRDSLPELPDTALQSEEISVVLSDGAHEDDSTVAISATVLKPQANDKVRRITELTGRFTEGLRPLVLVRVDHSGGLWWVQDPVEMGEDGSFRSMSCFGNDATPNGTRFRVLVVTPRSGQEAAALKSGMAFADLPNGIPRSKEIVVELERPEAKEAESAE